MEQLKTVVFEATQEEYEHLALHLQRAHGAILFKTEFDPMKTTNGTVMPGEKHRYKGSVPKSFPMSEPEWVKALIAGGQ
ncbi:hypothetical protein [Paraburkholderia tropica]|uniref:hypothetical protein n=1 Tax=Paraburkholderia tropica TaxID=92647 RepID=UPI002AB6A26B|nr:hypothetical protein [Paraburkholderia tropica]